MRTPDLAVAASRGDDSAVQQLLLSIPWTTLRFLVGEVVYGGRVTDSFDHRVLSTYLNEYLGDFLFDTWKPFRLFHSEDDSQEEPVTEPEVAATEEPLADAA